MQATELWLHVVHIFYFLGWNLYGLGSFLHRLFILFSYKCCNCANISTIYWIICFKLFFELFVSNMQYYLPLFVQGGIILSGDYISTRNNDHLSFIVLSGVYWINFPLSCDITLLLLLMVNGSIIYLLILGIYWFEYLNVFLAVGMSLWSWKAA